MCVTGVAQATHDAVPYTCFVCVGGGVSGGGDGGGRVLADACACACACACA